MTVKDKLEIGLKPDAPYRPDNLPESEQNSTETPEERAAEDDGADSTSRDPRRRQAAQAAEANAPDEKIPDQ